MQAGKDSITQSKPQGHKKAIKARRNQSAEQIKTSAYVPIVSIYLSVHISIYSFTYVSIYTYIHI